MAKLDKNFFSDKEVLFVGYSTRNHFLCKEIYKAFERNGIKVFPLNKKAGGSSEVEIYKNLADLPQVPQTAYIHLKKDNTKQVINELADSGVKKIMFQNKRAVDQETLAECEKLGIETVVACPMMFVGTGIHRIHGFLAGVR